MAKKTNKKGRIKRLTTRKHSAEMWYVFSLIWFAVAIGNFVLGYPLIGGIFSMIGFLQLIIAIIQQIRERKK